ncbi:MAG: hypothetical protein V1793_22375 [Pseudomonadota bacterium]
MFIRLGLVLGVWAGFMVSGVPGTMAGTPHNDTRDRSVAAVVLYHQAREARPETVSYLSWSPVELLDNGRYKVTVVFTAANSSGRVVTKKQIVILDGSGSILRVMDCR